MWVLSSWLQGHEYIVSVLDTGSQSRACLGGAHCTLHSTVGLRSTRDLDMLLIASCYHQNLALFMRHIRDYRLF